VIRALTVEYILISLFAIATMRMINPDFLDWKFAGALLVVFFGLWVRDMVLTLREAAILSQLGVEEDDDDGYD
jgi:hypothetical protein